MIADVLKKNSKGKITGKLYLNDTDTTLYIVESQANYPKEFFYHLFFVLSMTVLFLIISLV